LNSEEENDNDENFQWPDPPPLLPSSGSDDADIRELNDSQ